MNFKYILSLNLFIIFINLIDCYRYSMGGRRGRDGNRRQSYNNHFKDEDYSSDFDKNQDEEEDDFEKGRGGPEGTTFYNSYEHGDFKKERDGQRGVNDDSFYNNYDEEDDFEKRRGVPKGAIFYNSLNKSDIEEGSDSPKGVSFFERGRQALQAKISPVVKSFAINLGLQTTTTEEPGIFEKTADKLSNAYEIYAPQARDLVGLQPSPIHKLKARAFRRYSKKLGKYADTRIKERRAQRAERKRVAALKDTVLDDLNQPQNKPKGISLFSSYRGDDDYDDHHYKYGRVRRHRKYYHDDDSLRETYW